VADLLNLSEQDVTNFDVCQIISPVLLVGLLLQAVP